MSADHDMTALRDDSIAVAVRLQKARRALESEPESVELWCALGDLIQLTEDDGVYSLADAKDAYCRALDIDPRDAEALESLGAYLDAVDDDPASAEPVLRRCLECGGGVQAVALLARVLSELGRRGEALALLDDFKRSDAQDPELGATRREIEEGVWDPPDTHDAAS